MKKAFSLVEIGFVLLIITVVFFTAVPFSVSNVKQARLIAEWKNYVEQINYTYETLKEYKKNKKLTIKASVSRLIGYLDGKKTENDYLDNYKFKMMNGYFYQKMSPKKFDEVYIDIKKRIIGVEYGDINCEKKENVPCATIWIDLNGKRKPNIVGKDIFLYEYYPDRVDPYGKGMSYNTLKYDCSRTGTGLSCSEYYLMGGSLK